MNIRIKICGITTLKDALLCANAGADALGFIFYELSPRYVLPAVAGKIIAALPPFITPVGVFVNASKEQIEQTIRQTGIRALQLSGDEKPDDCAGYTLLVIKSFRVKTIDEVKKIQSYTISSAMLDGASDGRYGGTGQLPDFSVALEMKKFHPLILAGGLSPENVVEAIEMVHPYAVDLNSGVESAPGKKDHKKIQLLFERLLTIHSVTT